MTGLARILRLLALIGLIALAAPAAAQEARLTAPDALNLAAAELAAGALDNALAIARAVHDGTPDPELKLAAARLIAAVHYQRSQFLRAEIWLRRAAEVPAGEQSRAALAADFAELRRANPWKVDLTFSIAPNDNVNNGSAADTILIWGLPFVLSPDARALAGTEIAGSADVTYRLSETATSRSTAGLLVYYRTYRLTGAAAAAAPDVTGADYAYGVLEASLGHERLFARLPGPTEMHLRFGASFYGGTLLDRHVKIEGLQAFDLGAMGRASLRVAFDRRYAAPGDAVTNAAAIGLGLETAMDNGDRLGLGLTLQQVRAADPLAENTSAGLSLRYALARPVLGAGLSFTLTGEGRDFPVSIYDPAGRQDLTIGAEITAVLRNLSAYGFSPTLSLETSRTRSNVALYDRASSAIRLGIQSNF